MNYTALAQSYSPFLIKKELQAILSHYLPASEVSGFSKLELHGKINDLVLANYRGEGYFKSFLVKEFMRRNVTAAFEVKVNQSRIDFLTINGDTKSFEVKSSLDNFSRLSKQMKDYSKVFEFNYIVVSPLNLKEAIFRTPENYGIWVIDGGTKSEVRQATRNQEFSSKSQITLLTKAERKKYFGSSCENNAISSYNQFKINQLFKIALRERYKKRWEFIKTNKNAILPIDLQFFFNTNISPSLIYCE